MVRVDLLARRVCDLGFTLGDSSFAPLIEELGRELESVGIRLRPRCYLSTEYGCVVRTSNVGLLFTDGFAGTRRIARAAGMRVRDRTSMLRTLRHETGHAFCYVHGLYLTDRFRDLFGVQGDFFDTYPDSWRPGPEHHRRVARGELIKVYAARHPDEDFAIAFQTFVADPAGCRDRYLGRPRVLEKLEYVQQAVTRHGGRPDDSDPGDLDEPIESVSATLAEWIDGVMKGGNYNLIAREPVA